MARQTFDTTLKTIVEACPADWLALDGKSVVPAKVIDADLATVSSAADKVLRVEAPEPYLFHMEFAAGHDGAKLPAKLNARNALLEDRHDLAVRSVAILLRPEASSPQITGKYERKLEGEEPYRVFRYGVIKVWQLDAQTLLAGGIAPVPLAPVAAVTQADLPGVLAKVAERFEGQPGPVARQLWRATINLMSLRYEDAFIQMLIQGVRSMEVHSVLDDMLDERGLQVQREMILRLGEERCGPPTAAVRKRIAAIEDPDRLFAILRKMFESSTWKALLAEDPPAASTAAPRPSRRPKNSKES